MPKPAVFDALFIPLIPSSFTSLLRYNLPDMLWFVSAILLIRALWFDNRKWQRIYIAAFCVLALAIETSQLSEKVPGTFDPLDFLFMGIGAFVEGLLYNFYITRREK
jgi:glycopeptide antibiotics resistance protein